MTNQEKYDEAFISRMRFNSMLQLIAAMEDNCKIIFDSYDILELYAYIKSNSSRVPELVGNVYGGLFKARK
jgi:hypothetical protein